MKTNPQTHNRTKTNPQTHNRMKTNPQTHNRRDKLYRTNLKKVTHGQTIFN
jgi:hypothetical protein